MRDIDCGNADIADVNKHVLDVCEEIVVITTGNFSNKFSV